jgi:S1-C subfamily serine protease
MTGDTSVPVKDILLQLGITASYNAGWVVRTVENNSLAARSGVEVGDVVTALGKTTLASDTEFKGSFEASTIKIKRNGQEKELPLK